MIDVNVDYYDDTPAGKDPDCFSPSLNQHHQTLWSKRLPSGKEFDLEPLRDNGKLLLSHKSELGEFILASDTIVHSLFYSSDDGTAFSDQVAYAKAFPSNTIKNQMPDVIMGFWQKEFGIACYTIFPARQINRRQTINQARGVHRKICDRFDLTLECIRRFYENKEAMNPLGETLNQYKSFFDLFESFKGYVDFFVFQDLVSKDYDSTIFWLPFDDFARSPLPQSPEEYLQYKDNVCSFIERRKQRMSSL